MGEKYRNSFDIELVNSMQAVYKTALALTKSHVHADEISQETFRVALEKRENFTAGTNMKNWLYAIERNVFRDFKKRMAKNKLREVYDETAAESYPLQPSQLDTILYCEAKQLVGTLPMEQQEVINMVVFDGMSYEDCANALELSKGTVKSRLSRARASLAERIDFIPASKQTSLGFN